MIDFNSLPLEIKRMVAKQLRRSDESYRIRVGKPNTASREQLKGRGLATLSLVNRELRKICLKGLFWVSLNRETSDFTCPDLFCSLYSESSRAESETRYSNTTFSRITQLWSLVSSSKERCHSKRPLSSYSTFFPVSQTFTESSSTTIGSSPLSSTCNLLL